MSLLLHFLCERFFVSNLLFFLLCSVVFSPPFFFFFLTVFLHLSFISFVGFFFFLLFFFMYLLVFPFFCSFLSFPQKCLFMLVSFLPFSFCFVLIVSNIFQNKFLFLWTFNLIFGFPCYQKKSPCSNFHFDRAHSYTFISRFFFYLLTLFMFPLLCVYPTDVRSLFVHPPHCYSPFFVAKIFSKKKKLFSPFYCWKTFVLLFSLLHHSLFSSLSVKPLQLFFSFFGFVFFLCCIFQACSFEK